MICLVCLNYNDWQTTISFVDSIKKYKSIDKIIVVDNCSSDNSFDKMFASFKENDNVDLIKTDRNGGYAFGNNQGIKHAIDKYNPDYLIISNPDVIFEDDLIPRLSNVLESDSNCALVTCRMLDRNKATSNLCYWKLPKSWFKEAIGCIFPFAKKNNVFPESGIYEVEAVPGSFFIAKTSIFSEVAFFDEGTFLYYEENILSHKLLSCGYNIKIIMDYSFVHNHSVTIDKNVKKIKKFKLLMRSSEYYWKKCFNINSISMIVLKLFHSIAILERRIIYLFKK